MKECITHRHACDCREAEFAGWKADRDAHRAAHPDAIIEREMWRDRAERAEALLREAGKMADMDWCDDSDCDCKYQQWRAKVRDFLGPEVKP